MGRTNWTNEKLLFRLLNNKSDRSRWDSIGVLRKRPGEELFETCKELVKSSDAKHRMVGIDILAQLGLTPRPFSQPTLEIFFNLLDIETDLNVLASLLFAIGHNNDDLDEAQIKKICSFAVNGDSQVKEGLVFALLGIDDRTAIDTLILLSTDKKRAIRDWATFGLGNMLNRNNKKIREALWNRVTDKDFDTKYEAIAGLAKRKDRRVKTVIERELAFANTGHCFSKPFST